MSDNFLKRMFYTLNPCDVECPYSGIGKVVAYLCYGTDCRCCLGFRMIFALLIGLGVGYMIWA